MGRKYFASYKFLHTRFDATKKHPSTKANPNTLELLLFLALF